MPLKKRPVIVLEKTEAGRQKIAEMLKRLSFSLDQQYYLEHTEAVSNLFTDLLEKGKPPCFFVTDIVTSENKSFYYLIRMLEKEPRFHNCAVLIYTNFTDPVSYAEVKKEFIHLPFRVAEKSMPIEKLTQLANDLITYQAENRHYLDLEEQFEVMQLKGDLNDIASAMELSAVYESKHAKSCRPSKVNVLRGRFFLDFWKRGKENLRSLLSKLREADPISSDFEKIRGEILKAEAVSDELKSKSATFLKYAQKMEPTYWKAIESLYEFHMEEENYAEAKKWLTQLIKEFPNQSRYCYRMGLLNQLEGDLSGALHNYFSAFHTAMSEGLSGFDPKDVMEVVDSSLELGRTLLKTTSGLGAETELDLPGAEAAELFHVVKKNNAQVRFALTHFVRREPNNPEHLNKMGITFRRSGDYSSALEMYSKALTLDSSDARVLLNRAVCKALLGGWTSAEEDLAQAVKVNDNPEDTLLIAHVQKVFSTRDANAVKGILI